MFAEREKAGGRMMISMIFVAMAAHCLEVRGDLPSAFTTRSSVFAHGRALGSGRVTGALSVPSNSAASCLEVAAGKTRAGSDEGADTHVRPGAGAAGAAG